MPTLDQVRERIKRNFPTQAQSDAKRQKPLAWNRETMHTIISSCGTYRIVKQEDPLNKGVYGYSLQLAATPLSLPKHLCGPFLHPKDAREAGQRHLEGQPLQADLA
jgi:hypothetical protein